MVVTLLPALIIITAGPGFWRDPGIGRMTNEKQQAILMLPLAAATLACCRTAPAWAICWAEPARAVAGGQGCGRQAAGEGGGGRHAGHLSLVKQMQSSRSGMPPSRTWMHWTSNGALPAIRGCCAPMHCVRWGSSVRPSPSTRACWAVPRMAPHATAWAVWPQSRATFAVLLSRWSRRA
jgi:hypothetical protein